MNEYYGAITPTDDFIAHWGIKGMKWGIRKARPQGNGVRKSFGYHRAEKKLAKLEAKANRNALLEKANRLDKVSKGARIAGRVGLGAAAAGTGASVIASKIHLPSLAKKHQDVFNQHDAKIKKAWENFDANNAKDWASGKSGYGSRYAARKELAYNQASYHKAELDKALKPIEDTQHKVEKAQGIARNAQLAGAGLAALGYGAAIGSKLRARSLRKTANDSAKMAAAKQRAAEFRKQMNAKYGVQTHSKKRR